MPEAEAAAFNDGCPLKNQNIVKLTFQWIEMQTIFNGGLLNVKNNNDNNNGPLYHGYL